MDFQNFHLEVAPQPHMLEAKDSEVFFDIPKGLPPKKVCAIFSDIHDYECSVYVIELKLDEPPLRYDPFAHELVNLDQPCSHGFVEKIPNIVIKGFERPCFCGIEDQLFIFEGMEREGCKLDEEGMSLLEWDAMMSVYAFKPSSFSEESNFRLDKIMLQEIGRLQGPKIEPEAVRYGPYALIFSTRVAYVSGSDSISGAIDFELYRPGHSTIRLPALRVRRRGGLLGSACSFYLLHPTSKRERLTPTWLDGFDVSKCPCARDRLVKSICCESSFTIHGFSLVNDHTFVVVTAVSELSFSLNLESPDEDWQIYDGPRLPHSDRNFVTENGLVMYPSGASLFESFHNRVEFPLSSHRSGSPRRNCLMELADGTNFAFVVQVGVNRAEIPHWTLDMLRLDVSEFGSSLENEKEREKLKLELMKDGIFFTMKGDDEFAKRMKSFKFLSRRNGDGYIPVCLLPL